MRLLPLATSSRPELVVDPRGRLVGEPPPASGTQVGVDGPLGRGRALYALPMAPVWLEPHQLLHDRGGGFVADPDGNLIGFEGVLVSRMLSARWVEDTRRLAG